MDNRVRFISLNGEVCRTGEASVSPKMNGIYHGTGAFETFLSDGGRIFRFTDHMERLARGLEYLGFRPSAIIDPAIIRTRINHLIEINGLREKRARIRIQISDTGTGGYAAEPLNDPLELITADEMPDEETGSVTLITSKVCVVPSVCKPAQCKLSNMLHYRDAMRQARKEGADDALMCTTDGFVAESAVANIFWFSKGKIFTPSADCDILPGIMRNALIELIRSTEPGDLQLLQGRYKPDVLNAAECIWLTNSVRGMLPVSAMDDREFEPGHPVFNMLSQRLQKHIAETSG